MGHPNEDRFRGGYEAFMTGDLVALADEYFAPDIMWHATGNNPLAGDFEGVGAVLENFGKLFEMSGGTFRLELHDVVANDDHGVALATSFAEREGRSLESRFAHVAHFSDGKMTESWIFSEDQAAIDAFWS